MTIFVTFFPFTFPPPPPSGPNWAEFLRFLLFVGFLNENQRFGRTEKINLFPRGKKDMPIKDSQPRPSRPWEPRWQMTCFDPVWPPSSATSEKGSSLNSRADLKRMPYVDSSIPGIRSIISRTFGINNMIISRTLSSATIWNQVQNTFPC